MGLAARKDLDLATPTQEVASPLAFAETLGALPHVVQVFTLQSDRTVYVWTVVDSFERNVRNSIYEAERNFFTKFPGTQFDFNVIEGDANTTVPGADSLLR